jgi:hypothetical protein
MEEGLHLELKEQTKTARGGFVFLLNYELGAGFDC